MSKELIAVDVDDVLFPFAENFVGYHNQRHGTAFSHDDMVTSYEELLGLPPAETSERIYDFHAEDDLHLEPIRDSQHVLASQADRYDFAIVTARHPRFEDRTREWLQKYFGDTFKEVVLVGFEDVVDKPRTKLEVCRDLGAVALVDDAVRHVASCSDGGVQGVLFGRYPWNASRSSLPGRVLQVGNWAEAGEYLDGRR